MRSTEALRCEDPQIKAAVNFLEENIMPENGVGTVDQGIHLILSPRENSPEPQPQKVKLIDLFVSRVKKLTGNA